MTMELHTIVNRVMEQNGIEPDTPDWKRICDEQQARPYPLRNVLHMPPNVSHGKPWYAKVDWDGVGIVFLLFLLCVLCMTVVGCGSEARIKYVRDPTHHCILLNDYRPRLHWDYLKNKPVPDDGRLVYRCDDNLLIGFDYKEARP